MNFELLANNVEKIHKVTSLYAKGAVNQLLTIRNWMIGFYIVEFEQSGKDRAEYGTQLLKKLSKKVAIKGLDRQMLGTCRLFYQRYPQICATVSRKLHGIDEIEMLPKEFDTENSYLKNVENQICDTVSRKFEMPPDVLISRLSFSHLREILPIDDPLERFFYEVECIKGTWSVRELRRQISSKLFFRAGISKKPELLLRQVDSEDFSKSLTVKNIYSLEFLGLDGKEAVTESDLEDAIMEHLQEFMLEMGKGFCFEARQKRLVIDDEYYFIDLVLYNRLLHCNVIVELKVDKFRYEHFGQLNSYVSYYKECEMTEGDNPPIGILLCTERGEKMVEYVLNGVDEQIFVSTYMLHLPDKKQLEAFLLAELKELGV